MNSNRVTAVMVLAVSVACATDYTWNQTSGTCSFQTNSYWTPSTGMPGASDRAFFTAAGTYGVKFEDHVTNVSATVGASGGADVTFDLGGYTWQLTNNLFFANTGTARFGGGTLKVNGLAGVGANQKLVLNSGTCSFGLMSTPAGGSLDVNGGDHSVSNGFTMFAPPAGGASLRLTNGTFTLNSSDGSRFSIYSSKISVEGGTFIHKGTFDVWESSTLVIYTNATFLSYTAPSFARTGKRMSAMNVYGGTVSNYGGFNVAMGADGGAATGVVHLVDGELYSAGMNVGGSSSDLRTTNAVGILWLSGGRLLLNGTLSLGLNNRTVGIYTQEEGAAWCNLVSVGAGASGARGETYLAGGSLATPSALGIGNSSGCVGRFVQTGGALIVSNSVNLGTAAGASGEYTYAGGSVWVNGSIVVGNAPWAFGKMTFSGPSFYVRDNLVIGSALSSTGELVVAGGVLSWPKGLNLGNASNSMGRLTQTGGELSLSNNNLVVGCASGASGDVNVSGGTLTVGGLVIMGSVSNSVGRLTQTGGAFVVGGLTVGNVSDTTGEVVIAGGSLTVTNRYALFVGTYGASGRLEISGGTNAIANARIGHGAGPGGGTGLLRFTGGQTYITNAMYADFIVGNAAGSPVGLGTGRVELVGGTLTVKRISGGPGYSEVLFDGGTLRCGENSDASFLTGLTKTTLTARGAVFDSNGNTVSLPITMINAAGNAGSFTKKGAGKLTLSSGANAFTGRVAVEQGELAVSGNVYLTGGVAISPGAVLNLSSATVSDALTASGTVSRIDGALWLKSGGVLTNGLGATLGGSGVVTGKVVFASGSAWARDKADDAGPLQVTAGAVFQSGVTVRLTGYTALDLAAGIPLVSAVSTGTIQVSGRMPVTLDGAAYSTWWTNLSADGKTLTARVILFGTLIKVL